MITRSVRGEEGAYTEVPKGGGGGVRARESRERERDRENERESASETTGYEPLKGGGLHRSPRGRGSPPPAPRTATLRGGLVFKAHRLLYHSTLDLRVIKKKKKKTLRAREGADHFRGRQPL